MKRFLSFLLALVLTLGLFPVHAHAEETEATEPIAVETTAPVETVPETEASVDAPVLDSGNDYKSQADYIGNNSTIRSSVGGREYNGSYYTSKDPEDWYYFVLTSKSKVTVSISSAHGWATATIETADGRAYSTGTRELDVGTHYIRVRTTNGDEDTYTLSVSSTAVGGSGGSGDGGGSTHTHSYTARIVYPTCTSRGYTVYTCTTCGYSYETDYTSKLSHTSSGWVVDVEPTCSKEGSKSLTCTVCGTKYLTDSIPATPHSFGAFAINTQATCSANGTRTKQCNICSTKVQERYSHLEAGKWELVAAPGTTKSGLYRKTCTICHAQEEQIIPALGYNQDHYAIDDGVTHIGADAFNVNYYDLFAVTSVTIPVSVTDVANEAFLNCQAENYYISDLAVWFRIDNNIPTVIQRSLYLNGKLLTDCVIPEGITKIPSWALAYTTLERITIPDSVTSIGEYAFNGCEALTSITLGNGVTTIGRDAFNGCMNLKEITIPDSVTSIGKFAFWGCTALAKVTLSQSLTAIEESTFMECTNLQEILIPSGVTTIGYDAFWKCTNLKRITIPAGVNTVEGTAFGSINPETGPAKIYFLGAVPGFDEPFLRSTKATVYYPANDKTWTTSVRNQLSATASLTWVACPHSFQNGTCTGCGAPNPNPSGTARLTRIAGDGRCQTAIEAAKELLVLQGRDKFYEVIIADGNNYPDALSGSYLSAAYDGAPILLVQNSQQNNVLNFLQEYLDEDYGWVFILGGENSISKSFENRVRNAGFNVERIAGTNRYDTSLQIIKMADWYLGKKSTKLLVCDGSGYADSLSASATGYPVLLVNGKSGSLTNAQKTYLRDAGKPEIYVIGGKNSVSDSILNELKQYGSSVKRIAGNGREETSAAVAYEFFPDATFAVLADGNNYPDGLSGGPVAYAKHAPLLLVRDGKEAAAKSYVGTHIKTGYILGGVNSVSDKCVKNIFGAECLIK